MRDWKPWVILLLVGSLFTLFEIRNSVVWATPRGTSTAESARTIRPGLIYSVEKLTAEATHVTSSAMSSNDYLSIVCTVDVWLDQGASTVAATTNETLLPGYERLWMLTSIGYEYLSIERVGGVDGLCTITVWR